MTPKPRFRNSFLLILAVLTMCCVGGCGYPRVSSRSYEITKALYSVCNQQNNDKLSTVAELISKSLEEGEISADEGRWLTAVIQQARAGAWEAATLETRQILEDQVEW